MRKVWPVIENMVVPSNKYFCLYVKDECLMSQLNSRNKVAYHIYKVDRSQDYARLIKSIDFFVHSR